MSAKLLRDAAQAIRNDAPSLDENRAWHPDVALAVADWLDNVWLNEPVADEEMRNALSVARAYLGSDR